MLLSFIKPRMVTRENKEYGLRVAGFVLIFLGFFVLRVSFLEGFSFISPDNKIASLEAHYAITIFRIISIMFGLILLFPSEYLISFLKKTAALVYPQRKINKCVFYFSIFLLLLLFSYLLMIFSGDVLFAEKNSLPEAGGMNVVLNIFKTVLNFFNSFIALFFISDISPESIDIPVYKLYVKENDLSMLNENLPESGNYYVPGHIIFDNETYAVKVRYRGDSKLHWYFPKKSWRIKLKDKKLLDSSNKLNIINPKYDSQLQTGLGYFIANSIGVLTPRDRPVAVFLNNKYYGVYSYTDQIDELFIRMNNRLPGDIFYGDNAQKKILFDSANNWDVMKTFDNDEERAKANMDLLIKNVRTNNLLDFYLFFEKHLKEEYIKFYAYNVLLGDIHVSNMHNHKLYFNPSNGVFEPIVWDQIPFSYPQSPLKADHNMLFNKISLIPLLVQEKNEYLYKLMRQLPEETVLDYINKTAEKIKYELEHDVYKNSPSSPWVLSFNKWQYAVEDLRKNVKERYAYLKKELSESNLTMYVVDGKFVVFDVSGSSAIKINNLHLYNKEGRCVILYKDLNFNFKKGEKEGGKTLCQTDSKNEFEILYPGKNRPLRYVYIFNEQLGITAEVIHAQSVINNKSLNVKIVHLNNLSDLPINIDKESLHPWRIYKKESRKIEWSGLQIIEKNLIINQNDQLIIQPGTTIKLAKDVSIISYGKIIADGTLAQAITFIPSTNKPWGAIILQGQNANGSVFNNCVIDGGSGTKHELVQYTGMLSAYNTEIIINNCHLKNNKKEDDAFNAKNSRVQITNTTFTNTFSDAIDFDFTTGTIENNKFNNINGDAIDLMTSHPVIKNNQITNTGDKGISIGEKSNPTITNNTITKSNIGIAIKDQSNATIINNKITNNKIGIAAYQKNWQYGGGGFGTIKNTNLCKNTQPISIQNKSRITIDNKQCTEQKCEYICKN